MKAKGEEMQSTNLHKSTQRFVEISEDLWRTEKGLGVSSQEFGLAAKSAKPWPMVRLGDVCEIKTGKKDVNQGNPKGKYPFFTCARTPTFSDTFSFDCEALLIAGNGDVGFTQKYIGKFEVYQRTYVLSNFRDVDIDFLYCILVGLFRDYAGLNRYGSSMPYIKMGVLKDFEFPLPPLSVQKEIVERLEKELGEADKVAAEFKRMAELADKEFKAELDETFGGLGNGELGTGNGNDSNRVERAERVEKGSGVSSQELGLAAKNTKSAKPWPMVRLGDVCERITKGTTPTSIGYQFVDEGVNFVKIESFNDDGIILPKKVTHITSDCHAALERSQLRSNDILFSIAGAIGRVVVVQESILPANTNQAFAIIRLRHYNEVDPLFMRFYLKSECVRTQYLPMQKTSAQTNLSLKNISDFLMVIPPIKVQKEIVAKLDAAKERCEKLKAEAERGLRASENLRKAILSEAFEL